MPGGELGVYDSSEALQAPPNYWFDTTAHPLFAELNQDLARRRECYSDLERRLPDFEESIGGIPLELCEHLAAYAHRFCDAGLEEHALTVLDEGVRWKGPQTEGTRYMEVAMSAASHGKIDLAYAIALDEPRIRSGARAQDAVPASMHAYTRAYFVTAWLHKTSPIYRTVKEHYGTSPLEQQYVARAEQHMDSLASLRDAVGRIPDCPPAGSTNWIVVALTRVYSDFTTPGAHRGWAERILTLDPRIAAAPF